MLSDTDKRIFLCVFAWVVAVVIGLTLRWSIGTFPALGVGSMVATVIALYAFRRKPVA